MKTAHIISLYFHHMDEETVEDFQFLRQIEHDFISGLSNQILAFLSELDNSLLGYQNTKLDRSLETKGAQNGMMQIPTSL